MSREKAGGQGATLCYPTSRMHTSSLITILQDILITVVHVLITDKKDAGMRIRLRCFPFDGGFTRNYGGQSP